MRLEEPAEDVDGKPMFFPGLAGVLRSSDKGESWSPRREMGKFNRLGRLHPSFPIRLGLVSLILFPPLDCFGQLFVLGRTQGVSGLELPGIHIFRQPVLFRGLSMIESAEANY